MAVKVRFDQSQAKAFTKEVRAEVNQYFKAKGISQHANFSMVLKTILLLGTYFGAYALIMLGGFFIWGMWALCLTMGVAMAGIGFSVSHDALHGSYSSNDKLNSVLGLSFDLLGANGYIWKITHNVIHHTYTNIHGHDEDLEVADFVRLSPHTPYKPIHRFQHVLAFPAYSFATIFWLLIKDVKYFFAKKLGPYEDKKHPAKEWVILIVTKIIVIAYMIVLPLMLLEITWWQWLIGFLTVHLTAGLILGVIFQLAHVVEDTEHPTYDETGLVHNAWLVHELETTNNFARRNKILSWYIGGLNYQIEHHFFPKVCHVHYPEISHIVKRTAEKYGFPYHEHDTFAAAVSSHYRTLKKFGRPPSMA